jgi:hypothetical protein
MVMFESLFSCVKKPGPVSNAKNLNISVEINISDHSQLQSNNECTCHGANKFHIKVLGKYYLLLLLYSTIRL